MSSDDTGLGIWNRIGVINNLNKVSIVSAYQSVKSNSSLDTKEEGSSVQGKQIHALENYLYSTKWINFYL